MQFGFHPVTGSNIKLSADTTEARRKNADNDFNTTVYGAKPFEGTVEFEVELTDLTKGVAGGTLQVGIKWLKSDSEILERNIPRWSIEGDDYCTWYYTEIWNKFKGNLIKTRYGSNIPDEVKQGEKIGMRVTHAGDLIFIVNGRSQGVAASNVYKEGYDVYPVLDIRRRCYAVKITRAGKLNQSSPCRSLNCH